MFSNSLNFFAISAVSAVQLLFPGSCRFRGKGVALLDKVPDANVRNVKGQPGNVT